MKFKLAVCQMDIVKEKEGNLQKAEKLVREAAEGRAHIVVLPELFNSPYVPRFFREYGEREPGPSVLMLSALAKELDIYIVGGSISERDGDVLYNTCYIFDRKGKVIGKQRKIHMFDVDVKGGLRMKESETFTPGEAITVVDTEYCKLGVAICYDIRFPELIRMIALAGAELIVIPASFTRATGRAHWDATVRCRAIDNQIFLAGASSATDSDPSHFQAYGHSCILSPWGEYLSEAGEEETIIYAEIDTDVIGSVREQLPLFHHRRPDLYNSITENS